MKKLKPFRTAMTWCLGIVILLIVAVLLMVLDGCSEAQPQSVQRWLYWTAVGDDGIEGQAARYDMRIASEELTDVNWFTATPVTGLPTPSPSGATDSMLVTFLAGESVWFGIRAIDDAGNIGALGNSYEIDAHAPAMIIDLRGIK